MGYLTSTDIAKPLGTTITQLLHIYGAVKQSNGTSLCIPNISTSSENIIGAYIDGSNVHVLSYKSRTGDYAVVVLEYIK